MASAFCCSQHRVRMCPLWGTLHEAWGSLWTGWAPGDSCLLRACRMHVGSHSRDQSLKALKQGLQVHYLTSSFSLLRAFSQVGDRSPSATSALSLSPLHKPVSFLA